jgi:hypothetical protein
MFEGLFICGRRQLRPVPGRPFNRRSEVKLPLSACALGNSEIVWCRAANLPKDILPYHVQVLRSEILDLVLLWAVEMHHRLVALISRIW